MRRFREAGRWGARIAVSLGIVTYILVDVDRQHLWASLTGVRVSWVALALALYLVGQGISALKWAVLGRSVGLRGSYLEYARFYFIGMFFNFLGVSTLGGDVVRALYLGRGHRPGLALNSVLFDRVSGLAILMALGSVTLLAYPQYHFAGPISFALMAGGIVLVVGWWTCPRLVKLLPKDNRIRRQVETDLAPFWRDRGVLLRAVALSLAFHLSQVCVQWLLGRAVGVTLPFSYCLVFHPVLSIMMALPVSIGGFGVREGGYLYFLGLIDVQDSVAVTIGLLWWVVTAIAGLVGGAIFFATGAELPNLRLRREEHSATAA
ncbi:MAG TPA: lysylphosphatidylglycerol synthase transmembrane domain-containing protein [Candidatus Eisenbacteria bacterium]|nr:lysylphosphatidylglycerol synthase transmembrane domain-containing protein [Candidatus Eisenbacteria bacterium]